MNIEFAFAKMNSMWEAAKSPNPNIRECAEEMIAKITQRVTAAGVIVCFDGKEFKPIY